MTRAALLALLLAAAAARADDRGFGIHRLATDVSKPSFAPDGKRLVVGRRDGGLSVIDVQSHATTPLTKTGRDPAWSPDGRFIAYVEGPHHVETIWIIAAAGGTPRKLTDGGSPVWQAESRGVFFVTHPEGNVQAISLEPGAAPRTVFDAAPVPYPIITADGSLLAYTRDRRLHVVDLRSGADVANLPHATEDPLLGAFSPEGRYLAIGATGTVNPGVLLIRFDNGTIHLLRRGPFTMPAWSRDGRLLAFDMRLEDALDVWVSDSPRFYNPAETKAPAPLQNDGKWHPRDRLFPELAHADQHGRVWRLGDIQGKLIFLSMWGLHSPLARDQLGLVQALYEESLSRADLVVLAIDVEATDVQEVRRFTKAMGLTVPVISAPGYVWGEPYAVPRSLILAPGRKVLSEQLGAFDPKDRSNWLENARAELARARERPEAAAVPRPTLGQPR
jgi:Tol biopolymer transport system component